MKDPFMDEDTMKYIMDTYLNDDHLEEFLEKNNLLMKQMHAGDESAVRKGLNHSGGLFRLNGIICATLFNYVDEDILDRIKALKDDHESFDGYSVSDFAIAALSLLGIEEYKGDSKKINSLIEVKFMF
jgi:hypothetical protein